MKHLLTIFLTFFLYANLFAQDKPNIVVIMLDDVSPNDISIYHRGLGAVSTPNIDKIGKEGLMLSDYYAQPSCTAGRAAFITGQYPIRTGLTSVGQPGSDVGLQAKDLSMAEALKEQGYNTLHAGKSHLGDLNKYLPTVHGFDEFFGFLYHLNIMEMPEQPEFPSDKDFAGRPRNVIHSKASNRMDNTTQKRWGVVGKQTIEDKGALGRERMRTFDEEVLDFTTDWLDKKSNDDDPFFVWFCPTRMHQQIHVSDEYAGKSGHSAYADALIQLDDIVGELLDKIDEMGETENTIVLFTSDNGVNLDHWPMAGSASFRGAKGTTWDGGFRVPMLVKWPNKIPENQYTGEFFTSEDWLPTLLAAAGNTDIKNDLLKGTRIDGKNFKVHLDGYNQLDVLLNNGESKRKEFFFFGENDLNAVRVNQWKVHFAVKDKWLDPLEHLPAGMIIDIKLDPYERSIDSEGWFLWMKEKTWIIPELGPSIKEFVKSMQEYPPSQSGSGIGASAILNKVKSSHHD